MAEEVNLNPVMPDKVIKELDRRADAVESKEVDWMYKKYAYINISTTGKTQTALCPKVMSLGSAPTGSHMNLYASEGGIRKMLPTITSVKMVNDGGQSYTDSYIWTIEFAFKVFTIEDLDKVEASFFIVGAEVAFDFGWMGTEIKDGINNTPSDKPMLANVYNFSFSLQDDGGFNCTVKCMSPNGLWPKESMGDVEALEDLTDANEQRFASYLESLKLGFATAFGVKNDLKASEKARGLFDSQNSLKKAHANIKVGDDSWDATFFSAEIVSKHGWGSFNDTEHFFAYTTLDTLIRYINAKLKMSNSTFRYKISEKEGGKIHPIHEIGSADPTMIVLPGKYSVYNENGKAEFDWSLSSTEYNASSVTGVNSQDDLIKFILISIDYMNEVYLKLSNASTRKTGGQKAPPKIQDFLQKIFNDIDQLTGGLISIITMPETPNQDTKKTVSSSRPATIIVANKRKSVDTTVAIKPYEFEILSKRSITKSVSMASDFEAETLMHASKSSIINGKSNFGALVNLYPECPGVGGKAKDDDGNGDVEEKSKNGDTKEEVKTETETTEVTTVITGVPDIVIPIEAQNNTMVQDGFIAQTAQNTKEIATEIKLQESLGAFGSIRPIDLMAAKAKYASGYTSQMVGSTQDLFRAYLTQLVATGDKKVKGSQFTEIVWMLKLGVTIDGIFGIKYLTPITVDRLPKVYRTKKGKNAKAYFSITSIEHSFDGQGGWETALDTVMRIQG